jgi:hypothetical protein
MERRSSSLPYHRLDFNNYCADFLSRIKAKLFAQSISREFWLNS